MKGKYLRKIGGLALTVLMLFGVAFVSSSEAQAQRRRRIVIVRPYPYRLYRPFGFGYRSWWGYPVRIRSVGIRFPVQPLRF